MKILFTCTYSAGGSGVWHRVRSMGKELIKRGHEVHVFSSNIESGTKKLAPDYEEISGLKCHRFKVRVSVGSKNAYIYNGGELVKKFNEVRPDVVDCQTYRHYEGTIIAKEANKLGIPVFLTTHAPFVSKKVRGFKLSLLSNVYDLFVGKSLLHKFKKIIAITKWEYPYLEKLGIKPENIVYIPNGIPKEFVDLKPSKKSKVSKIVFFGRVVPVKDIETLIRAFAMVKDKDIELEIKGPADPVYLKQLRNIIVKENIQNITFKDALYKSKDIIKESKEAQIYVLPSKREGMPQTIIEAMSCGFVVIGSDIDAGKELIQEGKTGFIFRQGDPEDLAFKLNHAIDNYPNLDKLKKQAKDFSSNFSWSSLANDLENLYVSNLNKL